MKTLTELYTEVNSIDEKQTPPNTCKLAERWQEE